MIIVKDNISLQEVKKIAEKTFGNLIKAVVDVETEIIAIDGQLHSDEEALLLENGAKQSNLWGINIYPHINGEDWIEFDSVINIRPSQNNFSRKVDNSLIREKIIKIVSKLIRK